MSDDLQAQLVSPQVHDDRRVTFRLNAPNAEQVQVTGIAGQPALDLAKDEKGIWQGIMGPLEPDLYSYVFEVDGATHVDPHNRHVKKWLSLESMVEVPADPPLLHEQAEVPHGAVHHHIYASKSAGHQRGVYVYTPPGYDRGQDTGYPTVFLLHGYGDDESAWIHVGRAHHIADNLIAQNEIQPTIIVMPYGHPLELERQADFDDYAGRNLKVMERDLFEDLIPFLSQHYALATDRQQRAIVGLSMGGGQSLTIGLKHLDRFAWVGGFSSGAPQGDINAQFPDLVANVDAVNMQLGLLWIGCGKDDFLLQRNNEFVKWLEDHQVKHTYRLTEGGHDWIVWRKYLAEFLTQMQDKRS